MQTKKCRNRSCRKEFKQYNTMQALCVDCAIKKAKKDNKKKKRKEIKQDKEKLKNRSDYLKEAQTVVNRYVRLRDSGKPCISCDKPDNGKHQRHAGHYRSVGSCSFLRFNLFNIHGQCATCNTHRSGNVIEYRIRLIKKVGIEKVEWLEAQNGIVKYDIEYLKRLKKVFAKKYRMLEKKK